MFSRRGPILIALSLVLALGAAWFGQSLADIAVRAACRRANTGPVVAAAMDIPFGTTVEARHVTVIPMLQGHAPRGRLPDASRTSRARSRAPRS